MGEGVAPAQEYTYIPNGEYGNVDKTIPTYPYPLDPLIPYPPTANNPAVCGDAQLHTFKLKQAPPRDSY